MEELEELEKEKQRYFSSKTHEMELFRARVEDFTAECRMRVEELRNRMKEVWSLYPISSYNYEYLINLSISPCCCTYGTNIYILFMIEIFPKLHNIFLRKLR